MFRSTILMQAPPANHMAPFVSLTVQPSASGKILFILVITS